MKVLFVTHCVPMGGGNHSLLQLMKELKQPPYNVEPVLLTPLNRTQFSSSIVNEATAIGIECITCRFFPFKWTERRLANYCRYVNNIISLIYVFFKVRKRGINLVHSNSSIIDFGAFLAYLLRVKHIWHIREFGDLDFGLKPLLGKHQEKFVYKFANQFIAISKKIKEHFIDKIPKERITVVYNGLSPELIKESVPKNYDGNLTFCMSGSLNSAKRQIDAIEAMDMLVNRKSHKNIKLIFLGDGIDRIALEKKVAGMHLSDNVVFAGWQHNPGVVYQKSQIGLMLSQNEGFGRVTLDYMSNKMAIIASDGGANPELVVDGYNGLLFPVGDVKELAAKMELLIENPHIIKELAENGYQCVLKNFCSKDNTMLVYKVYSDIYDSDCNKNIV